MVYMTYEFALLGTCVHMPYPLAIQVFAAGVLLPMEMLLVQWNGIVIIVIVIIVSIFVVIIIILSLLFHICHYNIPTLWMYFLSRASRLGREHHDDLAQFMLGMGYATEALHLPGISKRCAT